MEILLIMAVFIGLMYFMMVVPQKKRAEQQRKMLDSLEPGSRVLLNSGIFGTIRARGEQQLVIELAPGVEVTVLKQTVVRPATPDEEEIEYADDHPPARTPPPAPRRPSPPSSRRIPSTSPATTPFTSPVRTRSAPPTTPASVRRNADRSAPQWHHLHNPQVHSGLNAR
jgi:preprotein translocase subunit YajC